MPLTDEFHTQLTLDPKGRLTLPVSVREGLAGAGLDRLVVVALNGPKGGLAFFEPEAYDRIVKGRVRNADPFASATMTYLRAVASTSQTVGVDSNGRVLIPPLLRKLVGIDRDLVAFSALDWFEVWDLDRWERAFLHSTDLWDQETGNAAVPRGPEGA